jgi:hypothetical protein
MLQLLIILAENKSNPYIRSIIMQLLIILHQQKHDLPAWQIVRHSLSLFNEEAGEMSFSVLSRCVLGDTIKHKLEYMNNMYSSIHFMQEVDVEMREDNGKKFTQDHNYRKTFDENSDEVSAAREFLKARMRKVYGNGAMTQYDGSGKNPQAYKSATFSVLNQIPMTRKVPLWDIDVFKQLDKHIEKCKQFFWNTNFGQRHVFEWPEMVVCDDHIKRYVADNFDELSSDSDYSQGGSGSDDGDADIDNGDDDDDEVGDVQDNDLDTQSDSDSSLDSSSISPSQSPPYNYLQQFSRQTESSYKPYSVNSHRRVRKISENVLSPESAGSSNEAGGAESDDESVQDSDGADMGSQHRSRARSVSKTPEIDRTSWKAPNQSDPNAINIITDGKKRKRKQKNSYVYVSDDNNNISSDSD